MLLSSADRSLNGLAYRPIGHLLLVATNGGHFILTGDAGLGWWWRRHKKQEAGGGDVGMGEFVSGVCEYQSFS